MKNRPQGSKQPRNKPGCADKSAVRGLRQRSRERVQVQDVWSVTALKEEATGRLRNEVTFPVGDGTTGMQRFGAEVPAEAIVPQLRKYSNTVPNDAVARVGSLLRSASTAPVVLTYVPG